MPLLQELNLPRQKQASRRSKMLMTKSDDNDQNDDDDDDQDDDDDDQNDDDDDEQTDSDYDGDDFIHPKFSTHYDEDKKEETFDPIVQTPSHDDKTDDEDNDEDSHGINVKGDEMDDEGENEEDYANELYRDVNINLEGQQQSSYVSSRFVSNMLNPSPDTGIDSIFNLNTESTLRVDVSVTTTTELPLLSATTLLPPPTPIIPTLQQTPVPSPANVPTISLILGIVDKYLDHRMNKAVKVAVQLQSDRLRDEAQAENEDFLNKLDENIQKIIKEQVKDQTKIAGSNQGSKRRRAGKEPESTNAPKEKTSKTTGKSTEGSKSHHKSASDFAPAEETMHTTKDLEEPMEFDIGATDDQPVEEASQHPDCNLARKDDSRTSFNELMDTPLDFSTSVMNRLKVYTLTPELLAGPTYELMKRSCKSLVELEFFLEEVYKETTDQLNWNNPEGQQYPHDLRKLLPLIPTSRGRRVIPFDHFINIELEYLRGGVESARDVYSKRRIIVVTELQIVKWHNYKHLDWITIRRDDDKIYKFKEGNFKRLCIQDIKDMLLLLVQGKLTNLTVDERLTFNVSLRMFTRSIVI
nr:hypothetical protein [Tanacetum cinerariifolium]